MGNRKEIAEQIHADSTGSDTVIERPVIEFPDDDPVDHHVAAEHPFDAAEQVLATAS